MVASTPADAESLPVATRPGGLWAPPSRPVELRPSGFGPTVFDVASVALPAPRALALDSAFDVCHAGVVLRAILFVHGAMVVGVAFEARSVAGWLGLAAAGASVALPAVLLWLVLACAFRRWLGALPPAGQWTAAIGLGAFSAGTSAQLVGSLLPDAGAHSVALRLAPAMAGAALAAAIFQWLNLRAKCTLPAETAARLAELQSRIRPHFLFNTLNTALVLVRLDPARAEGMLEDLAELFRVAIVDSGEAVSLGEEVELAQRYVAIEQIRFGDRLRVSWELDPAAASARVPALLLQPLVENAVRHGIEPSAEGGALRVRTRARHGCAEIAIDNSVPNTNTRRRGNGIALKNVRERLRLMHDVTARFEIHSGADAFRVQIVVPL